MMLMLSAPPPWGASFSNQIRVDNLDALVDRGDEEVILVLARTFPA